MSLDKRIKAFVRLGTFLSQFKASDKHGDVEDINAKFYDDFVELIARQKSYNGWFTKENVLEAIHNISQMLVEEELNLWLSSYGKVDAKSSKRIGVIMAGNIPLVGFHDMLCVLLSGNTLIAKVASNDATLIRQLGAILVAIEETFKESIVFVEKLTDFDAVIATGSDNTSRYFEYYFKQYPHIIRKNRNAIGVIQSSDTREDLQLLGKDVFQYFGLGCRNVSKLFVPRGYDFDVFFQAIFENFQHVTNNNKYANNYDYNKAIYLMGNVSLLDNGFLLLKEDEAISSPVGVLHYEYYDALDEVKKGVSLSSDSIQCVVANGKFPEAKKFGEAQQPKLEDYADGVDTIEFLLGLN